MRNAVNINKQVVTNGILPPNFRIMVRLAFVECVICQVMSMVFAKRGWIIKKKKLDVSNIEVGAKVPIEKEQIEDIKIKRVTVMLYPFSYKGPSVKGYFDLYTRDFVLRKCYIYQSKDDLNKGYAELCLG
jgi:hypothetical protein